MHYGQQDAKKFRKNDNKAAEAGRLSLEDYDSMLSESRVYFGGSKRSSKMARSPDLRSNANKLQVAAAKLRNHDKLRDSVPRRDKVGARGKADKYDGSLFLALSDMGASYNGDGTSIDFNRRVHTS